jgi:beta-aspartyl-peptidase (threonine type)
LPLLLRDDPGASWGVEGGAWAVLVHGGAGGDMGPDGAASVEGAAWAAGLAREILRAGGTALDAVERAVAALEDNPLFNAGTGACLNEQGLIELDASFMEGEGLRAGAVCALPPFRNPIAIARAALDDGRHVLYAGEGAALFARERGFSPSTQEALRTPAALARWKAGAQVGAAGSQGTVGAVARDVRGHVAAATSTGGIAGKRPGRVGDSPIPGAGTYADNGAGAASATGAGEAILRFGLARAAIEALRVGAHPQETARMQLTTLRDRLGGTGGLLVVDREGRIGWARSTASMPWAAAGASLPAVESGR